MQSFRWVGTFGSRVATANGTAQYGGQHGSCTVIYFRVVHFEFILKLCVSMRLLFARSIIDRMLRLIIVGDFESHLCTLCHDFERTLKRSH